MNRKLNKHFLWSALVACLGLGMILPRVNAEKKEEKKAAPTQEDKEAAKQVKAAEDGALLIEAIATAHKLIDFGRSGDETEQDAVKLTRAEALVLAARILKQTPLDTLKDLPEGAEKAEQIDTEKVIDGLLKDARELGKGDKVLAELIDRVKEGARGSTGGANSWPTFSIANGKSSLPLTRAYNHGAPATIIVVLGKNPLSVNANNLELLADAATAKADDLAKAIRPAHDAVIAASAAFGKATTETAKTAAQAKITAATTAWNKAIADAKAASTAAKAAHKLALAARKADTAATDPAAKHLPALKNVEAAGMATDSAATDADDATTAYEKNAKPLFDKLKMTGSAADEKAATSASTDLLKKHDVAAAKAADRKKARTVLHEAEKATNVLNVQIKNGTTVVASGAAGTTGASFTYNVPVLAKGAKPAPVTLTIVISNSTGKTAPCSVSTN